MQVTHPDAKGGEVSKLKWHSGPPPHIGWWRVDAARRGQTYWRWWNGHSWSMAARSGDALQVVSLVADIESAFWYAWCDYWPKNARVPRVDPR